MKVFVYFNLHKKMFSIKALEGPDKGRVIAHSQDVFLENVSFQVSQAGRDRVLHEQRKNVHAGLVGHWKPYFYCGAAVTANSNARKAKYNPYKWSTFVDAETETPVHCATAAVLRKPLGPFPASIHFII